MAQDRTSASFAALREDRRTQAMARLAVMRPHIEAEKQQSVAASWHFPDAHTMAWSERQNFGFLQGSS